MVATASRLHAIRYYQAIRDYIQEKGYDRGAGAIRAFVAFSGKVTDPDNETLEYRESLMNGFPESQLPERFATDDFQVLVVAEKYQTGFDQPMLHTMYVVKKLASVNAVQTLSRVNRIADGKSDTFVLDFVNDAEDIREAFEPFKDTKLEALYYYGKFLILRLPRADRGGGVDLDGAVILTHLRTDLVAEHQNLSLTDGTDDPLVGPQGGGRGKQNEQPLEALSALINALNERFGMDLGEADRIWFEQQKSVLRNDEDVTVVALNNDFQQFEVHLESKVQDKIVERHGANDGLFQAFFDKPEFKEQMLRWLTKSLYDGIRKEHGESA